MRSSPRKTPHLPALKDQQHPIGKPVNRPRKLVSTSPFDRPTLEPPKAHKDLRATENKTPEPNYIHHDNKQEDGLMTPSPMISTPKSGTHKSSPDIGTGQHGPRPRPDRMDVITKGGTTTTYPWDSAHHRSTPALPKTHQDLSTTDDTTPEHTYLDSTQSTLQGSNEQTANRN